MKDFIKKAQERAREVLHEELDVDYQSFTPDQGMPPIMFELNDAQLDYLIESIITEYNKEVVGMIEGLRKYVDQDHIKSGDLQTHYNDGYNQALTDIKAKLTSK